MQRINQTSLCSHRTLLLLRCFLLASALALLAAVVTFPVAPVRTYVNQNQAVRHSSKANKAGETGIEGAGEIPSTNEWTRLSEPSTESAARPDQELILSKLPRILRAYHFRPPPLR